MKKITVITVLSLLFATAFAAPKAAAVVAPADSLQSVWDYTEAVKRYAIYGDTVRAKALLHKAILCDSTLAPAYYELAASGMFDTPGEAIFLAKRAVQLDSTNKWYRSLLGQSLIAARRYDEALGVYRRLCRDDAQNPDNYRLLAALYQQQNLPYSALFVLDSAQMRFGNIPQLEDMKQRLLVATGQWDKAEAQAKAAIEAAPYDAENQVSLATLYALQNKDSLATATYERALKLDSTDVQTLSAMIDYYHDRHDYTTMLVVTQKLFALDDVPLDAKISNFEQLTSDIDFYRKYFPQLDAMALTLSVRYPKDPRVVNLYARHLMAGDGLETALKYYKTHLDDQPPVEDYYHTVIDIESYLQRPDSVTKYVARALQLFPAAADFHLAEANALSYAKQYDAAVEKYKAALKYADTDSLRSVIWGCIGDMQHQKAIDLNGGDETHFKGKSASPAKESLKSYDKALQYDPQNTMVLNNYAYFLAQTGQDLERALDMSGRVIAQDNNPTFTDTYAWILFRLGRLDEARKTLQQAIALDADQSPELMVHYGDILHALGEQFMAETYWQKALDKGYDAEQIKARMAQPAIQKPKETE